MRAGEIGWYASNSHFGVGLHRQAHRTLGCGLNSDQIDRHAGAVEGSEGQIQNCCWYAAIIDLSSRVVQAAPLFMRDRTKPRYGAVNPVRPG